VQLHKLIWKRLFRKSVLWLTLCSSYCYLYTVRMKKLSHCLRG